MKTILLTLISMALPLISAYGFTQALSPVRSLKEQRQERIILQAYDLSCGAAALATLLKYQHGEAIDERQVAIGLISREIYIANPAVLRQRQGFSLLDMKRFVDQRGYLGEALGALTLEELVARAPAVVPIRLQGYSHFVVFRGTLGGNVLLGDPAYGNRTLTLERFLHAWIDYAGFGHVGFTVSRRDGLIPPNQLAASVRDFPILLPNSQDEGDPL